MRRIIAIPASVSLLVVLLGCTGLQTERERAARKSLDTVTRSYRPHGQRLVALPNQNDGLSNFIHFAIANHPSVEAAYFDWAASVHRITIERSLPDPRLTFQSDIADVVMSLMPGLMVDFPGPGKLKAAADIAATESDAKYFVFERVVLESAFELKKAYYQLYFLDSKIEVNRQTVRLLQDLEKLAHTLNEAGKSTLQDVLRAQIERERLMTEIENLQDSRNPLVEQWKAALGLSGVDERPPIPNRFESTPLNVTSESLLRTALARNPRIKGMQAEIQRADALMRLAYKARIPDLTLGLEADAKGSPVMYRPQIGITLPIWRDKIAAQVSEAGAARKAAEARLSSEQIMLAVDFAEKSFMYREATRSVELVADRLLPKARQALEVAQSGYTASKTDFLNVLDAERTLLELSLSEVEARVQRELALADLSLLIAGTPPPMAPVLPVADRERKEKKP